MKAKNTFLLMMLVLRQTLGWNENLPTTSSRRQAIQIGASWLVGTSLADAAPPKAPPKYLSERGSEAAPLSPCNGRPMKKNCWSTEDTGGRRLERWVPPKELASKGPSAIASDLEETLAHYPQIGQSGADKGGWKLAQRVFSEENGVTYLRYEFTSGRFKYVDDLEIRVDAGGKVCTRTASREGGFDYDVNKTRMNFVSSLLSKKGWTAKKII